MSEYSTRFQQEGDFPPGTRPMQEQKPAAVALNDFLIESLKPALVFKNFVSAYHA